MGPYKRILKVYGLLWILFVFLSSSALAETQKYIIVFKDHAKKREMLKNSEFKKARSFHIIPAIADKLDSQQFEQLSKNPNVAYIEPDYPIYATGFKASNADPVTISASSSSQSIPYGIDMVGATQVWSKTKGSGAIVAVLDTGIAMYHPDRGTIIASTSFVTDQAVEDFDGHGTHTSGTVAAADNDIGVVGVAPEASLLIGKVLANDGSGQTSWLISGIEWAVDNGANVISMSLGSIDYSASLETACDNAFAQNVLLVAAAGNDNTSVPDYPAAFSSVVSVAAVDQYKTRASFSNYGSTVELAAPGVNILSTVPVDNNATADSIWSDVSHQSNVIEGTSAGMVTGQICNCGLATGLDPADSCPDSVAGNIAHIRRGDITFAEKVAYAQSKGAVGVIISNNISGNFFGTLGTGSPLVVVSISQEDGDALELLAESGISGMVSVTDDLYAYYDGTSMATPHVAGVAALIFAAQGSNISAQEVRDIMIDSAEDLGDPGRDDLYGYGLVDVDQAFATMAPLSCDAAWILGYGYPADIDMNCQVELNDLRLLATDWLSNGCNSANNWCDRADIDRSTVVSMPDLAELASKWLVCNDPQNTNCTPNW